MSSMTRDHARATGAPAPCHRLEAAHQRRAQCEHDAINLRFAHRERTHRTRLDGGVECAAGKHTRTERLLRLGDGDKLGVAGDVLVAHDAVDGFSDHLAPAGDQAGEGDLTGGSGSLRQFDATLHHCRIAGRNRWSAHSSSSW